MPLGRASWSGVRLAWVDAATSDLRFGTAAQRFGAQQQRRLAALKGGAAERFIVGRELLALVLDELAAEEAAIDGGMSSRRDVELAATCERCGGEHGALRVRGGTPATVSVSYAGSMVAVAAALLTDASAVGVDIEREPEEGAGASLSSLTTLFDPAPAPSTREWTLLEAALKADGRGITVDVAQCAIEVSAAGHAMRIPGRSEPVPVATLPGPAGFVLSVATIAPHAGAATG